MKDLLFDILMGSEDEDFFTSATNRLARLENQLDDSDKEGFKEKTGKSINQVTHELLDAFNADTVEDQMESLLEECDLQSLCEEDREVLQNQVQQELFFSPKNYCITESKQSNFLLI